MRQVTGLAQVLACVAVALGVSACNDKSSSSSGPPLMAEFFLDDVNPSSPRFASSPVSPRDYLTQVSAFYFGHSN